MSAIASASTAAASVEEYLVHCVSSQPGSSAVRNISELGDLVWLIELQSGERLVAKSQMAGAYSIDRSDDVLDVERAVLDILKADGCRVPRFLRAHRDGLFVLYDFLGERTLDDLCQDVPATPSIRYGMGRVLAENYCRIDSAFQRHWGNLGRHTAPAASSERLPELAVRIESGVITGLNQLFAKFLNSPPPAVLADGLRELCFWLLHRRPSLGSTDYNARNVVVDDGDWDGMPSFIEFARIGWDWPERRLVQYATALGAGRADGVVIDLVSIDVVNAYAEGGAGDPRERAAALDGHHLLFHLNAVALLGAAIDQPRLPQHRARLHAWRNPRERLAATAAAIAAPLSDFERCLAIRESVASALNPVLETIS